VKWKPIPTATGYFATAMGQGEDRNDMVTWSSSEVQEMGHALMDYIPPAASRALDTRESGDAAANDRVHGARGRVSRLTPRCSISSPMATS